MDGFKKNLLQFMDGHDKRFLIPVYQRNYDWKISNCGQLFDDLVKVIKSDRNSHFLGSIVSVQTQKQQEYLIIDGQQRLTTVSLLLLAMHNILKKGIAVSGFPLRADELYNEYLVDKYAPEATRIKLKPGKNDDEAFYSLFKNEECYRKDSKLTINYNYFYNRIQKGEINIDELYDAIRKLQIISIELNNDDNPQLIFESLNSTGLDLTEGDKIRNYVLMNQPKKIQDEFYENYWKPIELATNYDVSMFVRDYLSIKTQRTPSINSVYETFKQYADEPDIDIKGLLENLFQYAKFYEILLYAKSSYGKLDDRLDDDLRSAIKRLNWMEITVTRPFLLEVLRLFFVDEILVLDDLHDIFAVVENYIFRRNICNKPTNSLNKIFLNLNKEIVRYDGTYSNYAEKMKYALLLKKENSKYPDDSEFLKALSEKNIYNMQSKYRTYIMERYENFGTKEVKDVYKGVDEGVYTIEHIMPQNLTPAWIDAIGQNYRDVHFAWLHRIANLTLTAYNSKYSNETFDVKKTLTDKEGLGIGFANSGLRMNQWIAGKTHWTEEELIERDKHMCNLAQKIWPYIHTKFKPAEKPMDSVSLGEDADLTGRGISKFSFKGAEQPVASWTEAYTKILQILHRQDQSILAGLAFSNNPNEPLSIHVGANSDNFKSSAEIADGIYVWTGISTKYKISNLNKFFKLYNTDPDDLIFYLKDEKEQKTIGRQFEEDAVSPSGI